MDSKEIGMRLREIREKLRITQQELAEKLGTTNQNISSYELGKTRLSADKLKKICEALGITLDEILNINKNIETDEISMSKLSNLPLRVIPILGNIKAGLPIFAQENMEGYTYCSLNGNYDYFALRVIGDSMNASRIHEGDLIIVRKQPYVDNGDIAVILLDGEFATVKRVFYRNNSITLMPQSTNPEHKPLVFDITKDNIIILGKAVKVEFDIL